MNFLLTKAENIGTSKSIRVAGLLRMLTGLLLVFIGMGIGFLALRLLEDNMGKIVFITVAPLFFIGTAMLPWGFLELISNKRWAESHGLLKVVVIIFFGIPMFVVAFALTMRSTTYIADLAVKREATIQKENANEEKRFSQAVSEAIATIKASLNEYQTSLNAVNNAGGIDPEKITSTDDIQQRLKLFEIFEEANEKFDTTYQSLEQQIHERLLSFGETPEKAAQLVQIWKMRERPTLVKKIRDTDRRLIKTSRSVLELFLNQWGKWSYDVESQIISFNNDDAVVQYNQLIETLSSITHEQESLQKELLK